MDSTRMRTAAGLLGAVALCLAPPAQTFAGTHRAPDRKPVLCGTDQASGLAVWAADKGSCTTAVQVGAAYTKAARDSARAPVEVRVAGAAWKCRERQGDPNPYLECVSTSDGGRWVRLSS
ncbi:hypothetical protein ACH5A3_04850 [Streptomyces echinatus]|uniref:hypothetical protein n=1 Tax=Streptomyces echinatus TaxID=67293 RepID=UPI0037BDB856